MPKPNHFKRWKPYWFACPSCGHRSWEAYSNVRLLKAEPYWRWEFWCSQCDGLAMLVNPGVVGAVTLVCSVIVFVGLYSVLNLLLNYMDSPAIAIVIVVSAVFSYLLYALLGRIVQIYAVAPSDGL